MEAFLARTTANDIILGKIGIFSLKFAIAALVLYLVVQTIQHLPYLQGYLNRAWGQLIVLAISLVLAFLLVFFIPQLRILHEVGLVAKPRDLVWMDIILSTIVLSRSTFLWHMLIRYLDRRSSA